MENHAPLDPSWTRTLDADDHVRPRPVTAEHPMWRGRAREALHYTRGDAHGWVLGNGTHRDFYVVEVDAEGRYATVEELLELLQVAVLDGAMFVMPGMLSATHGVPVDPGPLVVVQTTARAGSPAAARLTLSDPGSAPPAPLTPR